jgi:hypothetical protein
VLPEGVQARAPAGIKLATLHQTRVAVHTEGSVCVGISAAGALTAGALSDLIRSEMITGRPVVILLGFTFGRPGEASWAEPALPPDVTGIHARLGRPWQHVGIGPALEILGAQIAAVQHLVHVPDS